MQNFLPPSIMYIAYVGIDRKNKWMRKVGAYMLYANLVLFLFLFLFFCKRYFVRRNFRVKFIRMPIHFLFLLFFMSIYRINN